MIEFDIAESNEKNNDLISLLSCHCIGYVEFKREEDEEKTIITVQYKGDTLIRKVSSDEYNPSKRRTASALLYEYEGDNDNIYMLLTVQHKGQENINFVKMKKSLHELLFVKYKKLKQF